MGADIFVNGNSTIDRFIQTLLRVESQPRVSLEDKKTVLNRRSAVLTDLDSKLSKLNNLAERLTDVLTNHFGAKTASTSDSDIFTATADSTSLVGSHDTTITRLASADTRVSKQYTKTATELKTFFDTNGSQTFQIDVAHPTSSDSSNRETISVTINSSGATNNDVLKDIALAINNAMSAAVTADTIDADEKVAASVVHEDDGTSRLIFKSGQSGFTYRQTFTDSTNSLLSTLEISNNVLSSGTSGGYITAIGTSATDSSLNAQLKVDGLTFYRDSNGISDIIDGVTFTLKNVTTSTETLQVSADTETVKKEVEDILNAYNDVIKYIRAKIKVDPDTKARGVLAGDTLYRNLRSTLRGIMTGQVTSVDSGNPAYLFDIGISAASDGTLSVTDSEDFEDALLASSSAIADLFNSSNGVATQLETLLHDYIKVGGFIDDGKKSVADRIKSTDGHIKRFDERLARREQQLRNQFAKMQQVSVLLGAQSATFQSIFSSFKF